MSPRRAASARFMFVAFFAVLIPQFASAQTCVAPTIVQIGGMNPTCAGSPVTLDAGEEWVSYIWSTGATTRTITETPLTDTTYTVTVTDALGCSVASSPHEVLVNDSIPPPEISLGQPEVCPGSSGYAMAGPPPPGISYAAYEWTVVNGTITDNSNTYSGVMFTASGAGPVEVTLTVTDDRGCRSTNSATVPLRSILPPAISLGQSDVCPGSSGYAMVGPPPPGISYAAYEWTVVNGTIIDNSNTYSGVMFTATGAGPVEVTLTVTDDRGCRSTNSATVPLRSIPPPAISLGQPAVCPGSTGYAMAGPPPPGISYAAYEWTVVNGTITDNSNTYSGVMFTASGAGPVEVTLTVTDNRGCRSTNSATVPLGLGTPPTISLMNPSVCSTETNRASVDSSYTSFNWSVVNATILSGQGTREIEFAGNGNGSISVSVSVINSEGCPGTNTVVVSSSAMPVDIFAPTTACAGSLQKVVGSTINGHNNFNWTIANATVEGPLNERELFFRASGTGPVTVSVTAQDYWGCATANSVTIPLGPMPVPQVQVNSDSICPLGYATAYLYSPDDVFATYNWTVTNAINVVASGGYVSFEHEPGAGDVSVTVSVGEGNCTATSATRTIPLRQAVEPIIELASPTVCQNGTGTIYFDNYNSFSYVSFYATNGDIISNSAGRVPGGRTITFRSNGGGDVSIQMYSDSNSCNQHRLLTATMIPAPTTITPSGPTSFCQGGSVTLTASEGISYLWSNGATTRSIVVTQAGNYTVTVTHASGCVVTSPGKVVFVQPLPDATITPSGPTSFCVGGSVTLTAPQSGNFLWSTGATTRSITVSTGGTYSVTITSAAGCVRSSSPVVVTVNPYPVAGIQSAQIYDDPGTGTITRTGDTIEACGNPTVRLVPLALNASYSYSWSTGATTAVLDVTTSGTYTVTVTSPSGCATASSVVVHYGAIPAKPTIAANGTELCPAGGSVTLTAPAADAWTWSNGATTQSILVNEPGSYTVRIRSGACDSLLSDPVVVTTGLSTITTNDSLALCGASSSATLTANDGTAWLWSNGATTRSIVVTQAGAYSVTTTNNGCTMPESSAVTVTERSVSIGAGGPTTFCEGGSVTLTASTGTSWLWSNGATSPSITVYASGSYGVTANFADGCSLSAAPVTVDARQVTASVVADRTTVCTNGAIVLQATAGGSAGYTYQWYDNTYTPIAGATSSTVTIHPTASGFVYVKVRDELGCEATSGGTTYTVLPTPDAMITTAAEICEGQSSSASVADAGAGATYSWTITNGILNFPNASSVTFTPSGLDPVTLTVTLTNAGCSVTSWKVVTILPRPAAVITPSGPTTFCTGGSVTLTASAGASYLWSNGATTQTINVTTGGNYSVTVTNASGCNATSAATAVVVNTMPVTPTINVSGPTTFCAGGSVTLTAPAGFTYLWSTGATSQSIIVSATGNYTVTVTNASGCSSTSAARSVTVNPATTITQQPLNKSIPKNTTAQLSVTATGTGTLTYQWYRGTSPSTATPISGATASTYTTPKLTRGTYTYWVRVTGTCGVANSITATVTVN